ncbi:MAG: peptide ABC transporter substrate-binding protein [Chloroflexi bacterium]|nr:peptide ABC transporter substrate-binding protein [Chloroflexota bacterium]
MSRVKTWLVISVVLIASMLLAACQPAPAAEAPAAEAEPVVLNICRSTAGDIPTIDPALGWDVISIQIIDETTVGLTRQNEVTTENELAMATSYTVSDDGLTYTFKIREDVQWVKWDGVAKEVVPVLDCEGNPRKVTAKDFEYGMLRTANPDTGADYAYVLGLTVDGAEAYSAGEAEDASGVGVKAIDDTTLEIRFLEPNVYNLSIIGLWFTHAQPSWLIDGDDCTEGVGNRWVETGFFQGYGPFVLKEWIHDSRLTLAKNPFWPGDAVVPSPTVDEIVWTTLSGSSCLAEFEAGTADISEIPSGDFDRITSDAKYKEMLFPVTELGTEFYSFNTQKAPTDDVRVRQALSMAIDREALVKVIKEGLVAPFFTHPGATGAPSPEKFPELGVKFDPEAANALLDEYLTEKGLTREDLDMVLMFNTSEGHKMRAEAIQQMWKENLGLDVQLTNQEWKVYKVTRTEGGENIYRSSWIQDYPDANNFLMEVFGIPGAGFSDVVDWSGPAHEEFVEILSVAAKETDPAKRQQLYADAEKILVSDEAVVAPLYWYSSLELRQSRFQMEPSVTGYERYEKWTLK